MDQITRPLSREPHAMILRPRPVSSLKNQEMTTYEPQWWENLKSRMGASK